MDGMRERSELQGFYVDAADAHAPAGLTSSTFSRQHRLDNPALPVRYYNKRTDEYGG